MFDIGFTELLLIGVVALIVIGPERLPKVARTAGHLFGRLQRYVADVKADINRELKLEELRKIEAEMREKAQSAEHVIMEEARSAEGELKGVAEQVSEPLQAATTPVTGTEPAIPAADTPPAAPSPQLELGLEATTKPADGEKTA
jgi:sec-independent protein translocase protein TatB